MPPKIKLPAIPTFPRASSARFGRRLLEERGVRLRVHLDLGGLRRLRLLPVLRHLLREWQDQAVDVPVVPIVDDALHRSLSRNAAMARGQEPSRRRVDE